MESVPVGQPSLAPVPMCITRGEWRVPVTLGISPWVRRSSLVTMANGTATLHLVFVSHVFTFLGLLSHSDDPRNWSLSSIVWFLMHCPLTIYILKFFLKTTWQFVTIFGFKHL